MSDEIIASYTTKNPTRENSRDLVREIAVTQGRSETKVRNLLMKAGVYVSLPRDKSKISPGDIESMISYFLSIESIDPQISKSDIVTKTVSNFGYSVGATSDFLGEWKRLGRPINSRQLDLARRRRDEERSIRYAEQINQSMSESRPNDHTEPRKGPDALGWIFLIVLSLLVATCVLNYDPDAGKSSNQRTAEKLCDIVGGCTK